MVAFKPRKLDIIQGTSIKPGTTLFVTKLSFGPQKDTYRYVLLVVLEHPLHVGFGFSSLTPSARAKSSRIKAPLWFLLKAPPDRAMRNSIAFRVPDNPILFFKQKQTASFIARFGGKMSSPWQRFFTWDPFTREPHSNFVSLNRVLSNICSLLRVPVVALRRRKGP